MRSRLERFWLKCPPGSWAPPAYRLFFLLFFFCPGAYPAALPLCKSTVGLLPPSGVTGQPAPFSPHLFQRSPWSSPPSASFTQSSSSRLTHFSSASFRAASVWVSRARILTWAAAPLPSSVYPADLFPSGVAWPFLRSSFTALQLLWVTEFLLRSTDLLFLVWEALKRDSCSWTSSSLSRFGNLSLYPGASQKPESWCWRESVILSLLSIISLACWRSSFKHSLSCSL